MSAAAGQSNQDPWDHEHTTKIFDANNDRATIAKAKAILHAKQMAMLIEQFQALVSPDRPPAPREALIKSWTGAVQALSADGEGLKLLTGKDLDAALDGLESSRREMMATVEQLKKVEQLASPAPHGPSSAMKTPVAAATPEQEHEAGELATTVFDAFQSQLGKRGAEEFQEIEKPQPQPLRTPTVPCKMPVMPGKY